MGQEGTNDDEPADADAAETNGEKHEVFDLTSGGAGEEEEEVLHTVRAKALKFGPPVIGDKDAGDTWVVKGLGPLKVLKHKETGASRMLLRADPSGTIVINKGLLSGVTYKPTGKTLRVLTAADDGKGLETWVLQVKTEDMAKELADVLEANKGEA